jgi:hypothetical protein
MPVMDIATKVQDWASEASDAFTQQKVPLNDTIRKIASRESLNLDKIARVVEEANKMTFLRMFPKVADKRFTFPIAKIGEIVGEAKPDPAVVKVAEMGRIRRPAPSLEKTATQKVEKRAFEGSGPQRAWSFYEKSALAAEVLRENAIMRGESLKASQVEFCKSAQQMVLGEGYSFEEICDALTSYRPAHWKKVAFLLKIAAAHIGRKFNLPADLEKRAGAAIDPGEHDIVTSISVSGMPVEVINGAHKIVVSLDTLIDQTTEAEKANKNLLSADDTVKFLRKELRNYIAVNRTV